MVLSAVGMGFLLLAIAAGTAVYAVQKNQAYSGRVSHTYEVASEVSDYRMYAERAEAARRGIILTGQPRFFAAYDQSVKQLSTRLQRVADLTRDNPAQVKRVERLRDLTDLQLSLFADAIAQVKAGQRDAAQREFGLNSSPEVMFALREVTTAMSSEEERLLAIRDAEREASARLAYAAFGVTGLIMAIVAVGSVWVILSYTRDLTASRNHLHLLNEGLEAAVAERTSDLSRANEEIQRFAYIVSHDLRSPLVNVMGFTSELEAAAGPLRTLVERAQAEAPKIVTAEARAAVEEDLPEAIGFIRSSTQKMDRLINAILRLSREGRRILSPELLDMDLLLAGVADSLRHRADEIGVEIVIEKPLPPLVNDRLAVEQVFSNLVENAVKYAKPQAARTEPGRVVIRGSSDKGRLVYEIQDNGRGVDPKDHERIFELFRRSGVQDQPGEGIGLAHVRALVYRLGGVITCDSALDRGATFRVSLPPRFSADTGAVP